ncbi:MAG: rod shape-determining protein RodA [Deltaproteobacteria bacterium]|nr:MAG: rod shape-determining protein RodA [Deltaproteobacteria bacterium]
MIDKRLLGQLDVKLVALVITLIAIGIINLYSATVNLAGVGLPFYQRQLWWLGIGVVIGLLVFLVDYHYFEEFAYPFYFLSLLCIVCVLIYGMVVGGAQRWIKIGLFTFQPSELMKIALIFVLAHHFAKYTGRDGYRLRDLLIPAIITIIPVGLIAKQPDLGTALVLFFVFLSTVIFVKIRFRSLLILLMVVILATPFFWAGLKDYQRTRILTFLNPNMDPLGAGYHIIQSKIAVGSGGIWGKGYLHGTQCKLQFLPEHHTDFVFAVLGEEWGFVGCGVVLALYLTLILWGLNTSVRAKDRYGALLAFGITAMLFFHVVVNVGMVLGIMPVVGLPLPFLSYGGSSIIVTLMGIGILLNVRARRYMF